MENKMSTKINYFMANTQWRNMFFLGNFLTWSSFIDHGDVARSSYYRELNSIIVNYEMLNFYMFIQV